VALEAQINNKINKDTVLLLRDYIWNKEYYSIRNLLLNDMTFQIVRFEIENFHKDSELAMKALEEVKEIYPERWI
jgi:hypothetical protein